MCYNHSCENPGADSSRTAKGYRGVAQFGRAPRSGRGGRGFKSRHLDQRDAGSKVALDSALFLCLFSDEGAAYAYFCRTEMHEVHKKGRKAAFLFIGPVGKYLTTALLYDTI